MRNLDQLLTEIRAKAKAGVITIEHLEAFLHDHGGTGYTVSVDYGKTIEEMVSSGRYDWSNDNITAKNFPVNGTGTVSVALELVHLNKDASSETVLSYLEENGMRPATIEELLAFGATYPEVQREFPVICFGSSWVNPSGNRNVPYLRRNGSNRKLDLHWFDNDWNAHCRFLAVRKSV